MDLIQKDISFDSCACDERIFVRVIEPAEKEDRRGVLQIAHGMAEHSMLYMDFADYMARAGFVVALNDHLGHGKSVSKGGSFGYFGEGGAQNLVRDMHKLYGIVHAEHPDLPYFLMGHSMGSFLARSYAAQYGGDLTAAIFMGTCGPQNRAVLAAQRRLADYMVAKLGACLLYTSALPVATKEQVLPSASLVVMVAVPAPWLVMVNRYPPSQVPL